MLYRISKWVLDLGIPISPIHLSKNKSEGAIQYLENHNELIYWSSLSENPFAIDLIKKNMDKVLFRHLCANSEGLDIVDHYHTSWYYLSSNPSIFTPDMFEYYFHANDFLVYIYVDRDEFSRNPSPHAIKLLENNIDFISWEYLSMNPSAMKLLFQYPHKIDWVTLNFNPAPEAVELLKCNPDKIVWKYFAKNPTAIQMLKENKEYITDQYIWENPAIFEIDYETMAKQRMDVLREELMMVTLHPSRIEKWLDAGLSIDDL